MPRRHHFTLHIGRGPRESTCLETLGFWVRVTNMERGGGGTGFCEGDQACMAGFSSKGKRLCWEVTSRSPASEPCRSPHKRACFPGHSSHSLSSLWQRLLFSPQVPRGRRLYLFPPSLHQEYLMMGLQAVQLLPTKMDNLINLYPPPKAHRNTISPSLYD